MSCDALEELRRKIELTGFRSFEKELLLVSKSGFAKKCLRRMESERVMHWDLTDIERMM